jgi:peptide/nickel transport system substrate-binding protein
VQEIRERGKRSMNKIAALCISIFTVFALASMLAVPAFAGGPRTPNLVIKIFYSPDPENYALETGDIDINDWPLAKEWIDKWAVNPAIQLREYAELGQMEFDLNNQMWPTGWPGFYDPNDWHYNASRDMRKAIAYLTEKDRIVSEVLKGLAYKMDAPFLPEPLKGYISPNMTIYNFDPWAAKALLDKWFPEGSTTNPYYDPSQPWSAQKIRQENSTGVWTDLAPLKFYIRLDDPNRKAAGEMLVARLRQSGIPVNPLIQERTVCYYNVMVLYDFHIYTGGWSLGTIPDSLYDLLHSKYDYRPTGWAPNYPGFRNHEYDSWAEKVKFATTEEGLYQATYKCTELAAEYVPEVPLWCAAAVKAYRTGWTGVVNNKGYGVDSYYTFFLASRSGYDTIKYGFKSEPEAIHVIASEWLWDWNVIGLIYESMMGNNPFSLKPTEYWLANDSQVTTWNNGTDELTKLVFNIRSGVQWQDGNPLTVADVEFSINFTKACGPAVAWTYSSVEYVNRTEIINGTALAVYMNVKSMFALQWIGGLAIIPKHIWETQFPDWNTPGWNSMPVRSWAPWTISYTVGQAKTKCFGTGAWVFKEWSHGNYISLAAFTSHYYSPETLEARIKDSFWQFMGDVNKNLVVEGLDHARMVKAMAPLQPLDPDCDISGPAGKPDGKVDAYDYHVLEMNFGAVAG